MLPCGNHDGRRGACTHIPTVTFPNTQISQILYIQVLLQAAPSENIVIRIKPAASSLNFNDLHSKSFFFPGNFHHLCGKNIYASDAFWNYKTCSICTNRKFKKYLLHIHVNLLGYSWNWTNIKVLLSKKCFQRIWDNLKLYKDFLGETSSPHTSLYLQE